MPWISIWLPVHTLTTKYMVVGAGAAGSNCHVPAVGSEAAGGDAADGLAAGGRARDVGEAGLAGAWALPQPTPASAATMLIAAGPRKRFV